MPRKAVLAGADDVGSGTGQRLHAAEIQRNRWLGVAPVPVRLIVIVPVVAPVIPLTLVSCPALLNVRLPVVMTGEPPSLSGELTLYSQLVPELDWPVSTALTLMVIGLPSESYASMGMCVLSPFAEVPVRARETPVLKRQSASGEGQIIVSAKVAGDHQILARTAGVIDETHAASARAFRREHWDRSPSRPAGTIAIGRR